MRDNKKVTAIVGSYRKGGIVDTVIDEILASAEEEGAETGKIYLIDKNIECPPKPLRAGIRHGMYGGHSPPYPSKDQFLKSKAKQSQPPGKSQCGSRLLRRALRGAPRNDCFLVSFPILECRKVVNAKVRT